MIYVILAGNLIDDSVIVVGYCRTEEEAKEYLKAHPNESPTGGMYNMQYSYEQAEHL